MLQPAQPSDATIAYIITPTVTGGFVVTTQRLDQIVMPTSILAAFENVESLITAIRAVLGVPTTPYPSPPAPTAQVFTLTIAGPTDYAAQNMDDDNPDAPTRP